MYHSGQISRATQLAKLTIAGQAYRTLECRSGCLRCRALRSCTQPYQRSPISLSGQPARRFFEASDISPPPCLLRLLPAGAESGWDERKRPQLKDRRKTLADAGNAVGDGDSRDSVFTSASERAHRALDTFVRAQGTIFLINRLIDAPRSKIRPVTRKTLGPVSSCALCII
jgi:hypothetical protein